MVPARACVRPMMLRTVVVLPMPLRPSSVAVSPGRIPKLTSESTWLAPYAVCRPLTSRSNFVSEIGLPDFGVRADGGRGPGGDDAAVYEHRDAVGQPEHRVHVVLHQQHGDAAAHAGDELEHAARFLRTHPRHRLV